MIDDFIKGQDPIVWVLVGIVLTIIWIVIIAIIEKQDARRKAKNK
jgi:hypothetical protein